MSYCTYSDLANVKTTAELLQLADLQQTGNIEDPTVQTVLQAACDQASSLIDGLISPQYPLPLATVPPMLLSIAVRLSLYYLYLGRASLPDEVKNGYDRDVAFLEKVGEGQASLGEPKTDESGDRYHGAKASGQPRQFTPRRTRGF
jgi:phage gp36-like protein